MGRNALKGLDVAQPPTLPPGTLSLSLLGLRAISHPNILPWKPLWAYSVPTSATSSCTALWPQTTARMTITTRLPTDGQLALTGKLSVLSHHPRSLTFGLESVSMTNLASASNFTVTDSTTPYLMLSMRVNPLPRPRSMRITPQQCTATTGMPLESIFLPLLN